MIQQKTHYAVIASIASVLTVAVLILIKSYAYWKSGSASILASLIDSFVDSGVSIMTFFAIQYSLKPPDSEHRHGHGKIEGLVAVLQGAFIAGAGIALLVESAIRFQKTEEITAHPAALVIMGISIVLSAVLVTIQKYALRTAPSLAVEADRAHYSMDILINTGVMAVLVALYYGAPRWIDPAFAAAVVIYLAINVVAIVRKGVDMLLDRELPDETREQIKACVLAHEGVRGLHDLRTHKSGMRIFISFDVEVDGDQPLSDAHAIARDLETELVEKFPNAEIMIHVDPHGDSYDKRHHAAAVHLL